MVSDASKSSFSASLMVLIIKATFWSPYGKIFTKTITTQKMANFQKNCHSPLNNCFELGLWCLSTELLRWNTLLTQLCPKRWSIWKMVWDTSKPSFQQALWSLTSERHFKALMAKSSPKPITTQNMAKLQHTVTRPLWIVVFSCYYCAYRQRDILKLLPWNPHLSPSQAKIRPICKMPSDASKSFHSANLTLLIVRAKF